MIIDEEEVQRLERAVERYIDAGERNSAIP